MKPAPQTDSNRIIRRNRMVAIACAGVFAGMVGLAYASVPLYRLYCQVTGFDGTPQIAKTGSATVSERTIEVRFDANVASDLPWQFGPDARSVRVKLGETALAYFHAKNIGAKRSTGAATFNVTPDWAGQYFNKIQCFCFSEQTLVEGENAEMPVTFFVDPAILDDVGGAELPAITLSYTFYAAETPVATGATTQPVSGGS